MSFRMSALLVSTMALAGCAPSVTPQFARLKDASKLGPITLDRPLVLLVEKGDELPLYFALEGPLFKSPADAPPIMLSATRRFYLRLDKSGLRSSFDQNDFSGSPAEHGMFRIGFGVTPKGPEARFTIRTPLPREPTK